MTSFKFRIPFKRFFFAKKKTDDDHVSISNNDTNSNSKIEVNELSQGKDNSICSVISMQSKENYVCSEVLLGKGGYASVFAGFRKSDNCKMAFKICPKKLDDSEHELFLRREVKAMRLLQHPNIVKLHHYYQLEDNHVIVLECLEGGELLDRILTKSHFTEKVARDTLVDILAAVKHCHDNNIVHRDIKPENFILSSSTDDATTKLTDFGFAIKLDENNLGDNDDEGKDNGREICDDCGTPEYMAPEVMMGLPYGKPVDMWAVGVILYILLCGYPPFPNQDLHRLVRHVTAGKFTFHEKQWSKISEDAKDLIRRLLRVNPAERLTAEAALAHSWVTKDADLLSSSDLSKSLERMRRSHAAKKWRVSIKAVIAVNKMQRLSQALAQARALKEMDAELSGSEKMPLTKETMLKHSAKNDAEGVGPWMKDSHSEASTDIDYTTDLEGDVFKFENKGQIRYAELLEE